MQAKCTFTYTTCMYVHIHVLYENKGVEGQGKKGLILIITLWKQQLHILYSAIRKFAT